LLNVDLLIEVGEAVVEVPHVPEHRPHRWPQRPTGRRGIRADKMWYRMGGGKMPCRGKGVEEIRVIQEPRPLLVPTVALTDGGPLISMDPAAAAGVAGSPSVESPEGWRKRAAAAAAGVWGAAAARVPLASSWVRARGAVRRGRLRGWATNTTIPEA